MTFDPAFVFYRDEREILALEMLADMAAEAEAERITRLDFYPRLVAKGRMKREDMEREIRVMTAIARALDGGRGAGPSATWTERVHCLRREIGLRRTLYPRWITTRRIDAEDAARKLRTMESIHDMTWNFTWTDEAIEGRAETERRNAA